MSRERLKSNWSEKYRRVGRWAKFKGGIATKRMAWPQYVEVKNGVEWWSPLPIKTEEPKNADALAVNLIQLSVVDRVQSGCSE
jgi:hypothetical protein